MALVSTTVLSAKSFSRRLARDVDRRDVEALVALAGTHPEHLGLALGRHPVGDLAYVVDHAAGLLAGGVGLGLAVLLGEVRQAGAGGVTDQAEHVLQRLVDGVDAAFLHAGQHVGERVGGVGEVVGLDALDLGARSASGALDDHRSRARRSTPG